MEGLGLTYIWQLEVEGSNPGVGKFFLLYSMRFVRQSLLHATLRQKQRVVHRLSSAVTLLVHPSKMQCNFASCELVP